MSARIWQLLALKRLYLKRMCGEHFTQLQEKMPQKTHSMTSIMNGRGDELDSLIASCSLCTRSKLTTKRVSGFVNPRALICFITANPLVESTHNQLVFAPNKSATMLQNMIAHVFKISPQACSILSLLKCPIESTPHTDEVSMCLEFLHKQLECMAPQVIVLFGRECAQYILGQNLEGVRDFRDYGRILWHNNRSFLLTYSLGEIVRNPSLKPQVMQHLLVAKGVL